MWTERLRPLVERSGQWAILAESPLSITTASVINKGCGGYTYGEFEAVTRKCEDGIYRLYVRYIGTAALAAA